jgi:hypothetical protein
MREPRGFAKWWKDTMPEMVGGADNNELMRRRISRAAVREIKDHLDHLDSYQQNRAEFAATAAVSGSERYKTERVDFSSKTPNPVGTQNGERRELS